MRHLKAGRKLSRSDTHRRAMLRNMVASLFDLGRIRTTDAKAKEARPVAEKMITFAKRGPNNLHARRQVLRYISDEAIVDKLFATIAPSLMDRNGGYTRILKIGRRRGDAAPISVLELVNAPEPVLKEEDDEKGKKKAKAKAEKDEGATDVKEGAKKKRKDKKMMLGAGKTA